MYTSSC